MYQEVEEGGGGRRRGRRMRWRWRRRKGLNSSAITKAPFNECCPYARALWSAWKWSKFKTRCLIFVMFYHPEYIIELGHGWRQWRGEWRIGVNKTIWCTQPGNLKTIILSVTKSPIFTFVENRLNKCLCDFACILEFCAGKHVIDKLGKQFNNALIVPYFTKTFILPIYLPIWHPDFGKRSACILLVFLQNCTTIKNWQHCIPFVPHLYIRGNRNTLKRHKHTHIKMPDFFWKGIFKWTWSPFRAKSLSFYDKTPLTKVTYPP